jgi:ankyrin repeat protein
MGVGNNESSLVIDSIDFPFVNGGAPMLDAVARREAGMVDALLASGADVNLANKQGLTALHMAALMYDSALVTRFVSAGANVNQIDRLGNTPLHLAFHMGLLAYRAGTLSSKSPAAKALLQAGADKTIANAQGITPADILAKTRDLGDIASQYGALIRDYETDLYLGRDSTRTPLFKVVFAGDQARAASMLVEGHSPNIPTAIGVTPLHVAAFLDSQGLAQLLASHGARLDAVDARGNTPLHVACALGHMALASTLVRLGADKTKRDARGKVPFELLLASDGALLRADYDHAD